MFRWTAPALDFLDLEHVNAMAMPVLGHRVVLNFQAEAEGVTPEKVIAVDKRP